MMERFFFSILGMLLCANVWAANWLDWSGLYVGAQAGGRWASAHWKYLNNNPYDSAGPTSPILGSRNHFYPSSITGGAQVGFNYQSCRYIYSIEAACTNGGLSQKRSNALQIFPPSHQRIQTLISSFALATGRVGYLFHPIWLIYAKAGFASATVKTQGQTSPGLPGLLLDWKVSRRHDGWIVGAGLEYKLCKVMTAALEYNYISLIKTKHIGRVSGGVIGPTNQIEHNIEAGIHTIMTRLNFLVW